MSTGALARGGAAEPRHFLRIVVIWLVVAVIVDLIVVLVVGPHIPPPRASNAASDQHDINVLLTALAVPVLLGIWVYFGYAIVVFRQRGEEIVDGPPIQGDSRVQTIWLAVTTVLVLFLAVYGSISLFAKDGVGGGQGPNPAAKPSAAVLATALPVQVIGQQWLWTFRFPTYGGVETPTLELPINRQIVFHVTSLDVAHSFWAYELGVKADAIPGSDNVAYVRPTQLTTIQIRCAELCGLWHGHMNLIGRVVSQSAFASWIARQQLAFRGVAKYLPPFRLVYYPTPSRRA